MFNGNSFTEEDLDKRERTACNHIYRRTLNDSVSAKGEQIENYKCVECGKTRRVTRPEKETKETVETIEQNLTER